MEKLIIRGAEIRHLNMAAPKEGAPFMRLHLRADLTGAIQDAMGWEEIPMCVASVAKLPGELLATSVEILPNGSNLKMYERCLQITAAEDFRAVPLKDDDGEVEDHALELSLKIAEQDSILAAVALALAIGRATCQLSISYEQPAQGKLELAHAGVDDGGPSGFHPSDEDEKEGADGSELNQTFEEAFEAAEEREPAEDAGPLPSAVTMAGSTEKLRKARRARTPRPTSDPGAVDWDAEQALDPNVPHSSVEGM